MAIYSPIEVTDNYIKASAVKAQSPFWRLFVLAFFAGILISLGAVASSTAAQGIPDTGVARLVSGAIFPIGLMMVVLLGTELFTGNALMFTSVLDGLITWKQLLRNWGIVYVGNFAGAFMMAALMAFFGQLDVGGNLAAYTMKVAQAKCSLTWENAFVLGIFCNFLVCIAIYLGNTAHETSGKILGIFFPIFGFVIAGFEHCVANMYYIPAGIFASMNPQYSGVVDSLTSMGVNLSSLDFASFFLSNLIPVTLGNIIGGIAVGVIMYVTHLRFSRKA